MNTVSSLAKAYSLAAQWHARQRRKGKAREPYVVHLVEVAQLVTEASAGADIDLTIAAVLHDAIEDAGIAPAQIEALFGPEVAQLVLEVTDNKALPYAERKRLQVETMPHKSARAKMIKLADKTSNLRSLAKSPPSWPLERKLEYLRWSRAVVAGARGINAALEDAFETAGAELEIVLAGNATGGPA